MRARRRAGLAGVVLLATAPLLVPAPGRAEAGALPECSSVTDQTDLVAAPPQPSVPLQEMDMLGADAYARRHGPYPGTGVTVAVIDSGIADLPTLVRDDRSRSFTDLDSAPSDYHGTMIAGVIGGRADNGVIVGVAPAARLIDLRVYDSEDAVPVSGEQPLRTSTVIDALRWVLQNLGGPHPIDIVNISLTIQPDDTVEKLVRELWDAGVVVVAPTGDRGGVSFLTDPSLETYQGSEDVAGLVFPAGYPDVVAVNATAQGAGDADPTSGSASPTADPTAAAPLPDATGDVYANSATDVAAPAAGALSYGANGGVCLVQEPDTGVAAAEVTGILAILKSTYPDLDNHQLVARLEQTATGLPGSPTVFTGDGVVQPLAALTQPLHLDQDGVIAPPSRSAGAGVPAVEPQRPDPLGHTRHDVIWWALAGGAAIGLSLLLAPVLSRRRVAR